MRGLYELTDIAMAYEVHHSLVMFLPVAVKL
ncbi:Protein of unknown function [Escherichia coli D6-113.11]|nr:Protein of unknown function [Escherichia coli D6-113.11]CDU35744.1 Protein of unknown function [Escherichia coli D6-113.11]